MKTVEFISHFLLASSIVSIAIVGYLYQPLLKQYLELKARQDCAQSYRLEFTDSTNTTIIRPVEDLYATCLSEKGLG